MCACAYVHVHVCMWHVHVHVQVPSHLGQVHVHVCLLDCCFAFVVYFDTDQAVRRPARPRALLPLTPRAGPGEMLSVSACDVTLKAY